MSTTLSAGRRPATPIFQGVILRLNDDGIAPTDNPFFGANSQKIYSYGHREGFCMAFDPLLGALWATQNADDAYSQLNRVMPGMNGG